jgi:hypothetical protein
MLDLADYLAANNLFSFEGERGVRNLKTVLKDVCDYGNDGFGDPLHEFFADNSGAIEAVLNWIAEQRVPEWQANMEVDDEEEEMDDSGWYQDEHEDDE